MNKLKKLKDKETDREKVTDWLDKIQEFDQACRDEVLDQCAKDKDARQYFVNRHKELAERVTC